MGKFCIPDDFFFLKCQFFDNTPLEIGLVQEILHVGNLWRTKFLVTLDSVHGRESI